MHPVLFNIPLPWIGGVSIRAYGFMVMLGFLAAILTASWRAKKEHADANAIWDMWMWALIAGFVGARVFYVALFWEQFEDDFLKVFKIWEGGLAFQGGFIGALVALLVYLKRKHLPALRYLDIIAAAVILGYAFARGGCFLNGCCHGHVTDVAWAVTYPAAAPINAQGDMRVSPAYEAQTTGKPQRLAKWVLRSPRYKGMFEEGHLKDFYRDWIKGGMQGPMPHSLPVHPTQIYAIFAALLIFVILNVYYSRPRHEGQVAALFGILYAVYRFTDEFFRGDSAKACLGMTLFQLVCIGIFIGFILFWFWCRTHAPVYKRPEPKKELAKSRA